MWILFCRLSESQNHHVKRQRSFRITSCCPTYVHSVVPKCAYMILPSIFPGTSSCQMQSAVGVGAEGCSAHLAPRVLCWCTEENSFEDCILLIQTCKLFLEVYWLWKCICNRMWGLQPTKSWSGCPLRANDFVQKAERLWSELVLVPLWIQFCTCSMCISRCL